MAHRYHQGDIILLAELLAHGSCASPLRILGTDFCAESDCGDASRTPPWWVCASCSRCASPLLFYFQPRIFEPLPLRYSIISRNPNKPFCSTGASILWGPMGSQVLTTYPAQMNPPRSPSHTARCSGCSDCRPSCCDSLPKSM